MLSSSEKITQPPWAQKHLGMSVNLATFGGENKEYKIKSQPIDRFCLISLLYNWTYELMVSPTLYNLGAAANSFKNLKMMFEPVKIILNTIIIWPQEEVVVKFVNHCTNPHKSEA